MASSNFPVSKILDRHGAQLFQGENASKLFPPGITGNGKFPDAGIVALRK
ncbi:MAG: hypothetical protein PVJ14_09305 [Chromatiales bacterium]|jgi:hypothetical protein